MFRGLKFPVEIYFPFRYNKSNIQIKLPAGIEFSAVKIEAGIEAVQEWASLFNITHPIISRIKVNKSLVESQHVTLKLINQLYVLELNKAFSVEFNDLILVDLNCTCTNLTGSIKSIPQVKFSISLTQNEVTATYDHIPYNKFTSIANSWNSSLVKVLLPKLLAKYAIISCACFNNSVCREKFKLSKEYMLIENTACANIKLEIPFGNQAPMKLQSENLPFNRQDIWLLSRSNQQFMFEFTYPSGLCKCIIVQLVSIFTFLARARKTI